MATVTVPRSALKTTKTRQPRQWTPRRTRSGTPKKRSSSQKSNRSRRGSQQRNFRPKQFSRDQEVVARQRSYNVNTKKLERNLIGIQESWENSLLANLLTGKVVYVPPSIHFDDNPFSAQIVAPMIYSTGDYTTFNQTMPTNVRVCALGNGGTQIEYDSTKRFNYTTNTGFANYTLPLVAGTIAWVWADPYDVMYPIKVSLGPNADNVATGFDYGPWTCGFGSSSGAFDPTTGSPWYKNFDSVYLTGGWTSTPYTSPNDWTMGQYGVVPQNGNYYALYPNTSTLAYDASITTLAEGVSNLYFAENVSMIVEAADKTGFSGCAMKVRNVASSFNRLIDRIENPATGNYGNTTNFTPATRAHCLWTADKWTQARIPSSLVSGGEVPLIIPNEGNFITAGGPACSYMWYSLNRAIQEGWPLVEIQINGTSDSSIDFSVNLNMSVHTAPLYLAGTSGSTDSAGLNNLTAPFTMPTWFSAYRSHARLQYEPVEPADTSDLYMRGTLAASVNPGLSASAIVRQRMASRAPLLSQREQHPIAQSLMRSITSQMQPTLSPSTVAAYDYDTVVPADSVSQTGSHRGTASKIGSVVTDVANTVKDVVGAVRDVVDTFKGMRIP
jgi:hypothetical protein